jgi:hypothetical protein
MAQFYKFNSCIRLIYKGNVITDWELYKLILKLFLGIKNVQNTKAIDCVQNTKAIDCWYQVTTRYQDLLKSPADKNLSER